MITVKVKKGYDPPVQGVPSERLEALDQPACVGMVPEAIPFVKPRLLVEKGDTVKIGTPLFEDKRNPSFKFLSPGAGVVSDIRFGPRRVIRAIVIELAEVEQGERLETVSPAEIPRIEREHLIRILMAGGVWPFLRALPFRDIAPPDAQDLAPAVFVHLDDKEPFTASPAVYLRDQQPLFALGLTVLSKLAKQVYVCVGKTQALPFTDLTTAPDQRTCTYSGRYPADDPGVLLYHLKRSADENRAWFIDGQDLLAMARFIESGRYPVERVVSLGGTGTIQPGHFLTRMGVPLAHIAEGRTSSDVLRYVVGGLFRGFTGSADGFMGHYQAGLTLIPEPGEGEFFGFVRPGLKKPSRSRAFLSALNPKRLPMTANQNGDRRACINCGNCARVCPVDIFPQFAMKSVVADELEESLELGLLDCVECGLCAYVCPAKIELAQILKDAKAAYYKEISAI